MKRKNPDDLNSSKEMNGLTQFQNSTVLEHHPTFGRLSINHKEQSEVTLEETHISDFT